MMSAVGDSCELPLRFGVNVGALMKGAEELVPLVCVGAKEVLLALLLLKVEGLNGSSQAPLLSDQAGNVIVHVMKQLELSCNSTVFLGSQVVVHGSVGRVLGEQVKESVGKFPFFVDGNALGSEQLLVVNWLADAGSAQAVQAVMFDEGGKDMYDVITVSDCEEEI